MATAIWKALCFWMGWSCGPINKIGCEKGYAYPSLFCLKKTMRNSSEVLCVRLIKVTIDFISHTNVLIYIWKHISKNISCKFRDVAPYNKIISSLCFSKIKIKIIIISSLCFDISKVQDIIVLYFFVVEYYHLWKGLFLFNKKKKKKFVRFFQ